MHLSACSMNADATTELCCLTGNRKVGVDVDAGVVGIDLVQHPQDAVRVAAAVGVIKAVVDVAVVTLMGLACTWPGPLFSFKLVVVDLCVVCLFSRSEPAAV